jgi:tRNA (cytidine/uridine-2'-O-)-methyltransferase
LSAHAERAHQTVAYRADDILLAGRESAGVPDEVRSRAELSVRVPMMPGRRTLNVVSALAIVLGEALRQTGRFQAGD